jgi:hypothetical protein
MTAEVTSTLPVYMVPGDLDEDGQRAFLSTADAASQSLLVFNELRQLSAALADEVADGCAVNHLEGAYRNYALAVPADEGQAAAMRRRRPAIRPARPPIGGANVAVERRRTSGHVVMISRS